MEIYTENHLVTHGASVFRPMKEITSFEKYMKEYVEPIKLRLT